MTGPLTYATQMTRIDDLHRSAAARRAGRQLRGTRRAYRRATVAAAR